MTETVVSGKTALVSDMYNQFAARDEKYWKIGKNTGNILFSTALHSIVHCDIVDFWSKDKFNNYDSLISTEMIWLQENVSPGPIATYWFESLKNTRLIPMSIGLQAQSFKSDFKMHPKMIETLSAAQERAVLAVRGTYTAEILNRHGIKNISIIGCPSVYQLPLFQSSFSSLIKHRSVRDCVANYKTFVGPLSDRDKEILNYIMEHCTGFVEQTLLPPVSSDTADAMLLDWFGRNTSLFFDLESWLRHLDRYDFSFGLRFHGNVAALLAGMRALFVTIDSRTREMVEFFKFPSIEMADFECSRSIDEYFSMADFSGFALVFPTLMENLGAFMAKNDLTTRQSFSDAKARFEFLG
jgi:hypothetical protein